MTCTDVSSPERNLPAIFLTTLLPSPSPTPTTSSSALRDDEARFPRPQRDAPKEPPDAEEKQKRCRRVLLCVCVFFSKRVVVVEGPFAKDQEDQDEGGDNMMMMMMMMMMWRAILSALFLSSVTNESRKRGANLQTLNPKHREQKEKQKTRDSF